MLKQSYYLRLCFFLLALSTLSACGFQLRGAVELPEDFSPVFVQANRAYELARDVKAQLRSSNVEMVDNPASANVSLILVKEKKSRRVISVNSDGRASEYLLLYTVDVTFTGPGITRHVGGHVDGQGEGQAGKVVDTVKESVTLNRSLIFDPDTVLAAANESATLYRDMKRDAAQRILFKLKALSGEVAVKGGKPVSVQTTTDGIEQQ